MVAEYLDRLVDKYYKILTDRDSCEVFNWRYGFLKVHYDDYDWDILLAQDWMSMPKSRRKIQEILTDSFYLIVDSSSYLPDPLVYGLVEFGKTYADVTDLTIEDQFVLESLKGDKEENHKFSEYLRVNRVKDFSNYLSQRGIKKISVPMTRSLRNAEYLTRVLASFCESGWKIDGISYRLNTKLLEKPTHSKKEETIYNLILE